MTEVIESPTAAQARGTVGHLVTVTYRPDDDAEESVAVTGVLVHVMEVLDMGMLFVENGFVEGQYQALGENPRIGKASGWGILCDQVLVLEDHGDRSDALLLIQRDQQALKQAWEAVKAYEANIARAYEALVQGIITQEEASDG